MDITLVLIIVVLIALAISNIIDIKKAINLDSIQAIGQILDAVKLLAPENNVVDKITEYAKIGVGYAEQAYINDDLSKGERKEFAVKYIKEALTLAGIDVTGGVEKMVDGAIEAAVLALGHKTSPP